MDTASDFANNLEYYKTTKQKESHVLLVKNT